MKNYQKAEMIAKNLPTGSYAAGCPQYYGTVNASLNPGSTRYEQCKSCETNM